MNSSQKLYAEISDFYRYYSSGKNQYLQSIDNEIIKIIKRCQPQKLMDIGTGDGYRFANLSQYLPVEAEAFLIDDCSRKQRCRVTRAK